MPSQATALSIYNSRNCKRSAPLWNDMPTTQSLRNVQHFICNLLHTDTILFVSCAHFVSHIRPVVFCTAQAYKRHFALYIAWFACVASISSSKEFVTVQVLAFIKANSFDTCLKQCGAEGVGCGTSEFMSRPKFLQGVPRKGPTS